MRIINTYYINGYIVYEIEYSKYLIKVMNFIGIGIR